MDKIGAVPNLDSAMRRGPYRFFMQDKRQAAVERMEKDFQVERVMLKGKFGWATWGVPEFQVGTDHASHLQVLNFDDSC